MGNLQQTGRAIVRLLRWDKPAGRLILLIPALWALVLASDGRPHPLLVLVVVVGTIATSAAGCVVNDLWDRNIDPKVERTKQRPLAARSLSVKVGVGVMLVAALCAAGLLPFLNGLSVLLCVAAVPVIALYPAAKRVFPVPQLVLAIAWGFAVLIPWSAAINPPSLDLPAWLLWGAVVLWTLGFDTVYALADREDDRRVGIHSSALFFGDLAPQAIGAFYAGTALLLAYTALALELNIGFWLTLFGAIGLWVRQYLRLSDRQLSRAAYGKMFAENVTIGFVLLAGMLVGCWF
jgi:4-hydroxybenzoate polyprenyltransferase